MGSGVVAEVITGEQIRAGREMLGWSRVRLGKRANLHPAIVERAERGLLPTTAYQQARLRATLEEAGVEFTNGDEPSVKLNAQGKKAK